MSKCCTNMTNRNVYWIFFSSHYIYPFQNKIQNKLFIYFHSILLFIILWFIITPIPANPFSHMFIISYQSLLDEQAWRIKSRKDHPCKIPFSFSHFVGCWVKHYFQGFNFLGLFALDMNLPLASILLYVELMFTPTFIPAVFFRGIFVI